MMSVLTVLLPYRDERETLSSEDDDDERGPRVRRDLTERKVNCVATVGPKFSGCTEPIQRGPIPYKTYYDSKSF